MKLLLTSAGLTTPALADALKNLVGKEPEQTTIGFIPTAANVEEGNKNWFIATLTDLQKHGYGWIDLIDIAAPRVDWQTRLAPVDVIFVNGGNTYYLLEQVRRTGFDQWLPHQLKSKVYVGVSAGSILPTPTIQTSDDPNLPGLTDFTGLGLVPFTLEPHRGTISEAEQPGFLSLSPHGCYALDDQSGLALNGKGAKPQLITKGQATFYPPQR